MSLKAVHIAFISLSVLLSVGFAVWALQQFAQNRGYLQTQIRRALGFCLVDSQPNGWGPER